ncbi:MAG TPA: hypothetical protein VHP58_00985 [Alphaproteobacteria bacterium]|nr:hypothetical protein [Alphaproteobacteria bacterium]
MSKSLMHHHTLPATEPQNRAIRSNSKNHVVSLDPLRNSHPWVQELEKQVRLASNIEGLIVVTDPELPSFRATAKTAPRALKILSSVLKSLENGRHKVRLDNGKMLIQVQGEMLEVRLYEECSRRFLSEKELTKLRFSNPFKKSVDEPTGCLKLLIKNDEVGYVRPLTETGRRGLEFKVTEILTALNQAAVTVKKLRERKAEEDVARKAYWMEWDKQQEEKALADRRMDQFIKWANEWQEIERLESFLGYLKSNLANLPPEHELNNIFTTAKQQLLQRREKFGSTLAS